MVMGELLLLLFFGIITTPFGAHTTQGLTNVEISCNQADSEVRGFDAKGEEPFPGSLNSQTQR